MDKTSPFYTSLLWVGIVLLILAPEALAKKVVIEWKPIPGAKSYEVLVQKEGRVLAKKTLPDPKWKGDLPYGAYLYQIRGVDQIDRPGQWTQLKSLVVMPPPPESQSPPDGSRIILYSQNIETQLKWSETPGVQSYKIEVMSQDKKVLTETTVEGTHFNLKGLPTGKIIWRVKPVLKMDGRAPASLKGKSWEGAEYQQSDFKVEYRELESPRLVKPLGSTSTSDDGKVLFKWKEVEGAEGYEVRMISAPQGTKGRALANELSRSQSFFTRELQLKANVSGGETHYWSVRALAHLDENKKAQAVGPESVGHFSFDRNEVYKGDLGYVAFSAMFAPYSYRIVNPQLGVEGATQSTSAVFRTSGEFWIAPLWAIAAASEFSNYVLLNRSFTRPTFELTGKFRTNLSSGQFGWSLSPKAGIEVRDYNEVDPVNPSNISLGINMKDLFVAGAAVGFDLRKQFSEKFGMGIKTSYFLPFAFLSGAPSGSLLTPPSYQNLSLGVQGLYWLTRSLGFGAGGYFESRKIGFIAPSLTKGAEEIDMNGAYFFGSVVYRFWR